MDMNANTCEDINTREDVNAEPERAQRWMTLKSPRFDGVCLMFNGKVTVVEVVSEDETKRVFMEFQSRQALVEFCESLVQRADAVLGIERGSEQQRGGNE